MDISLFIDQLEELVKETAEQSEAPKFDKLQSYLGTSLHVAGLRSAEIKNLYKETAAELPPNPLVQLDIWHKVWQASEWFEVMSMPLLFVRQKARKLDKKDLLSRLVKWQQRIDNWAHSDELAHAFAFQLQVQEKEVSDLLSLYNRSSNHWDRRQSLVVPIRINRKDGKQLPWPLLESWLLNLLDDPDYFVQKGVGWCLRDLARNYPDEVYRFTDKHVTRLTVPAFATASEKVDSSLKERWKAERKMARL